MNSGMFFTNVIEPNLKELIAITSAIILFILGFIFSKKAKILINRQSIILNKLQESQQLLIDYELIKEHHHFDTFADMEVMVEVYKMDFITTYALCLDEIYNKWKPLYEKNLYLYSENAKKSINIIDNQITKLNHESYDTFGRDGFSANHPQKDKIIQYFIELAQCKSFYCHSLEFFLRDYLRNSVLGTKKCL